MTKKRPIIMWAITLFGFLLSFAMIQNVLGVLFGSNIQGGGVFSAKMILIDSAPLLISASIFSVLAFRLSRHAFWSWLTVVLAFIWTIASFLFAIAPLTSEGAHHDTYYVNLRYGPMAMWSIIFILIGIYLYRARKTGVLK